MERKNEKAEKERGGNVKFCSNDRELEGRKREEFFSVQNKLCILKGYHGICSSQSFCHQSFKLEEHLV